MANNNFDFYNVIRYNCPQPDYAGTPYFPSRHGVTNLVDATRNGRGNTNLIIFLIYQWGTLLVLSFQALLVIRFCLVEMNEEDNMYFDVLTFIAQAARDCEIRAKDVMSAVTEVNRPARLKLRLNGRIIAMGMAYYHRVGRPCSGFHELFFNGLMYVLQGVVGSTISDLE